MIPMISQRLRITPKMRSIKSQVKKIMIPKIGFLAYFSKSQNEKQEIIEESHMTNHPKFSHLAYIIKAQKIKTRSQTRISSS